MAMPTHIVAVGGIVENEQGEILLVKTQHGGWVYPGGQVEVGENLINALIREVKEESGIDIIVSNLIGVYSNTGIHKWYDDVTDVPTKLMMDYVCKPVSGELSTSEETSESRWVAKDEVLDLVTAPAIRTRYQAYLEFNGNINYMEYITKQNFELKLNRTI
ncbi:NUDIX hydrolase [Psychrobacillus sp. FSL H8-0484]|uniref:NUDIX hydrolase n=1 Tax=Psychrobacillus sp. FSL H8-0484 TaxID=2921390 RepID=UPI0030FBF4B7